MSESQKSALSGRGLMDRMMDFMDAGDVLVQGVNRKAGFQLLPEFSMVPTLLAVLGLSAVIAWSGASACKLLAERARAEKTGVVTEQGDVASAGQVRGAELFPGLQNGPKPGF